MIANALLATTVVLVAALFALLDAADCLSPYRDYILRQYCATLLSALGVLAVNLFGAFYLLGRTLFLKDTGRKLAHLEKQIRQRGGLVGDLAERLED